MALADVTGLGHVIARLRSRAEVAQGASAGSKSLAALARAAADALQSQQIRLQGPVGRAERLLGDTIEHLPERTTDACASCGSVESIRHTDPATGLPIYEFTVRMRDGSARESSETKPGRWRAGERVLLIGGAKARAADERENLAP